jgi:hypothetical protein
MAASVEGDAFEWYAPARMTGGQMGAIQSVGESLSARIDNIVTRYKDPLSPVELFHYFCLSDHMWDLRIDDDWAGFGEALDNRDSAEAAALILDTPLKGITRAREGYLPREEILAAAAEILKSARSDDLFATMIAIPKARYDEYGMAWCWRRRTTRAACTRASRVTVGCWNTITRSRVRGWGLIL